MVLRVVEIVADKIIQSGWLVDSNLAHGDLVEIVSRSIGHEFLNGDTGNDIPYVFIVVVPEANRSRPGTIDIALG